MSWRTVYGYFARWRDDGLWSRILKALNRRAKGRLFCIDSSYVRVNVSASNPAGGQHAQAMGASRGGLTTKIHALVDGRGRAMRLILSAGNVVDITRAPELVKGIASMGCSVLVADKGYDSDALRALLYEQHTFPCFAVSRKRLTSRDFHRGFYRKRHRIENFFCSIKKYRRIATRYDKLASSFLAFVSLAAILHWIR
jgi:transposase